MSPTQIANLEGDYLHRARQAKACGDFVTSAVWANAASLLIEAAGKKPTRRKFRPMDLNRIQG